MIPKLNISIDPSSEKNLKEDSLKLLKIIRPSWKTENICFKIYTEGVSNVLIGAWCEDFNVQVLIRVYGENTELFIDRKSEIETFKLLHSHGFGCELYAIFDNGIAYEYAVGIPLTPEIVKEERIYRGVAKQMAAIHKLEVQDKTPQLFPKMRLFLKYYSPDLKKEHVERLAAVGIDKAYLESEAAQLEAKIAAVDTSVVYCHNDLLLQNIVWNESDKSTTFIDFEYASPNYQLFDIGDHFSEFAGVGTDMDYDGLYPSPDFQAKWFRVYLSNYLGIKEEDVEESLVQKWYESVKPFVLMSHLFWSSWCVVQAHNSKIDFDFIGYCIERIQEYRRRKKEFYS